MRTGKTWRAPSSRPTGGWSSIRPSAIDVGLGAQEIELALEIARRHQSEMAPALRRHHAAAWRALDQALLDQEGLDDFLEHVALLGERGRQGLNPDRTALIGLGDAAHIAVVHRVEAAAVDLEPGQRGIRRLGIDRVGAVDGAEVAHRSEEHTS